MSFPSVQESIAAFKDVYTSFQKYERSHKYLEVKSKLGFFCIKWSANTTENRNKRSKPKDIVRCVNYLYSQILESDQWSESEQFRDATLLYNTVTCIKELKSEKLIWAVGQGKVCGLRHCIVNSQLQKLNEVTSNMEYYNRNSSNEFFSQVDCDDSIDSIQVDDFNVNEAFIGPVTLEIMDDPWTTPLGHIFDYSTLFALRDSKGNIKCPLTREIFNIDDCRPNTLLRKKINAWSRSFLKDHLCD